jgi:hypothetical protein
MLKISRLLGQYGFVINIANSIEGQSIDGRNRNKNRPPATETDIVATGNSSSEHISSCPVSQQIVELTDTPSMPTFFTNPPVQIMELFPAAFPRYQPRVIASPQYTNPPIPQSIAPRPLVPRPVPSAHSPPASRLLHVLSAVADAGFESPEEVVSISQFSEATRDEDICRYLDRAMGP